MNCEEKGKFQCTRAQVNVLAFDMYMCTYTSGMYTRGTTYMPSVHTYQVSKVKMS